MAPSNAESCRPCKVKTIELHAAASVVLAVVRGIMLVGIHLRVAPGRFLRDPSNVPLRVRAHDGDDVFIECVPSRIHVFPTSHPCTALRPHGHVDSVVSQLASALKPHS